MKKMKPSVKAALASTLVVTSTAAIVYANSDSMESKNTENDKNLALAVEKIDSNTVKVSIDNIVDIPKSLQFSIELDGAELENGDASIRDLVKKEAETRLANKEYRASSNNILTDYTYNSANNTIDVLITAEDSIPKTGNKIEVFELDVRKESAGLFSSKAPTYKVLPNEEVEYKYVTNTNKEVVSEGVSYEDKSIAMNAAPTISLKEDSKYVEVIEGEKLALTAENLGIEVADEDGETPKLEVKQGNNVITEFTSNTPGIYSLTATAIDSYGEKSEPLTLQVNVLRDNVTEEPTITRDGKPLENITINAGDIFEPMKGVSAVDAKNRELTVDVKSDKKLDLEPEVDTVYKLTYTATDSYGNTKEETITLTVKANNAPVIEGVRDHVLTVGDDFDATAGVTAHDVEDDKVELKVDSNVNTNEAGEYIVRYSATDSGNKTTRAESKVTVNPKMEAINNPPVITAEDITIEVGQHFDPKSYATAWDVEDEDLTDSIEYTTDFKEGVPGNYTVTYTVKDSKGATATKTIKVIVKEKVVIADSITINNKFDQLYVGSQKTLNATVNEEADIKKVEWETSDESIASIEVVGNEAKVIAKSEGEVTITAKTTDGSNKTDSVTIDIVEFENEDTLPSFIKDVIDSNVVKPVAGTGEENSPLELEVQNIKVEEFDKFLKELENLEPNLAEQYEDGNFTVYKIKLSRKARLFRKSSEGYIEIRIDNSLVSANEYKASIDKLLANNVPGQPGQPEQPGQPGQPEQPEQPEQPGEDEQPNKPVDPEEPGEDEQPNKPVDPEQPGQGEQGGNTNQEGNQDQGGNINQENNQGQGEVQDNTDNDGKTEDKKPSFGGIKLPATGQESIIGYVGIAATAIGGLLFGIKKKKK